MHLSLHNLWGSGRGPIKLATPHIRVVAGAMAFAACMVSTGATFAGSACTVVASGAWLLACRPPRRVPQASLLLGLAMFFPYFLLLPFLPNTSPVAADGFRQALVVPWTILLRGLSGMLVCSGMVVSLSATDLREALLRLPVPSIVSSILVQIVFQTVILFDETRRVATAMTMRGATSGWRLSWLVLVSFPQVWLSRVLEKAERVGAAMELRGFGDCGDCGVPLQPKAFGRAELVACGAGIVTLGAAIVVRVLC